MFEIIMLLAFLCAATCPLFPDRPTTTGPKLPKKKISEKKANRSLTPSTQKRQTVLKPQTKIKSRNHSHAHAA